jgi:hypothetical protein
MAPLWAVALDRLQAWIDGGLGYDEESAIKVTQALNLAESV